MWFCFWFLPFSIFRHIFFFFSKKLIFFFFKCYLAAPRPTLGHSQGDSLTNPTLITAFVHIQPGHWEPHNKVGSLSLAEHLAGFEPGAFQFLLQRLNPLGHSPRICTVTLSLLFGCIIKLCRASHLSWEYWHNFFL